MNGIIIKIGVSKKTKKIYGIIEGKDNNRYYFNERNLIYGLKMDMLKEGTSVTFDKIFTHDGRNIAERVEITDNSRLNTDNTVINSKSASDITNKGNVLQIQQKSIKKRKPIYSYYRPGYYQHLDKQKMKDAHLKADSGEYEILQKLKDVLYVTLVNHHNLGTSHATYPFVLLGSTSFLKQYIRGKYEFLLIFSHFDSCDWQQTTLQAVKHIRNRKEIVDRKPLVNFYILVSNARNLKTEIDKLKGGTESAIIPFSFDELLSCHTKDDIKRIILSRFDEYIYENNMLGEASPIEQDALLFGDRTKIADSIVQRCIENKHSGIFGLRRSGKSSVLNAVNRRLEKHNIKYVSIQARSALEGLDSWKTGLYDIARQIRISTLDLVQNEGETREQFNNRLNLNSTETDYQKRPTSCFVEDVKLYTGGKTFVIAIDEIELITYNTATSEMWRDLDSYKNFWGALRDCGCALVVCGVNSTINENSNIEFNGKTCDNPMYERIHNCADSPKTYLPVFTDQQTKYMINTLGGYSNIAFDNIYADINRAFGGQPYAIRQFCSYMYECIKDNRKQGEVYQFSKATYDALINDFNNSQKGIQLYQTMLQHIAIYNEEFNMLKKIAVSPENTRKVEFKDIPLIDHLEKYGLIEYDRTTFYVTFVIKSVQEYLQKTIQKEPENMNNDERRRYIQDRVALCEKKLKTYILNCYTYQGLESSGRSTLTRSLQINNNANPVPNPTNCEFRELFDHSKFIFYFSSIKNIIYNNWRIFKNGFDSVGITKERFKLYMEDLNAGRNDADHYDAEDMTYPDRWDISDVIMRKFIIAYESMEEFFKKANL